jgi:phosphoglycerol transferase MdoB-like AlkP superfamily enzyme
MKFEKILILYLASFLTLAGLSLRLVPGIFAGSCFFQTSWFSCGTSLSSPQKIAVTALIIAVVAIFGLVSWSIWNALAAGTTVSLKKIQTLFVVLALSSLVMIPFGSSDLSYYFEAGRALANGYNVHNNQPFSSSSP